MKKMMNKGLMLLLACIPAVAQTDLIYPWVTNNATFRGRVVINNLNDTEVTVNLTAQREGDASDAVLSQSVSVTVPAFAQHVAGADALFDQMGDGSAFMIRLTAEVDNITGAFVNVGTLSQSQSSPSQTNVFKASDIASTWLFNYMFIGGGFSAPTVINLGTQEALVTFYAYQDGLRAGEKQVTIGAGKPFADTTQSLFPELSGDMYLVAHAEGASLLASAFIFNEFEFLEPAMANAIPIDSVPNPESGVNSEVSYSVQIQPIFNRSCGDSGTGCHLNGGNSEGLVLDEGVAYNNIVNITSRFGETLVIPNDADNSYLFRKLQPIGNGVFYAGDRMPDPDGNTSFLSDSEITLIRDWIQQGALNN